MVLQLSDAASRLFENTMIHWDGGGAPDRPAGIRCRFFPLRLAFDAISLKGR